jgi:hypothetical protein
MGQHRSSRVRGRSLVEFRRLFGRHACAFNRRGATGRSALLSVTGGAGVSRCLFSFGPNEAHDTLDGLDPGPGGPDPLKFRPKSCVFQSRYCFAKHLGRPR